jgi:hypothetical protein
MNILNRLPDDLKDIIYYDVFKLNMKCIKNELDDYLDRKWDKMPIDTQDYYIDAYYHTEYAHYSLYDENERYIRPDKVAFNGYYRIIEKYNNNNDDDDIYISNLLINPTYADILLEVDKKISITGDYHHIFLEDVYIDGELFDKDINDNIKIIDMFLGS